MVTHRPGETVTRSLEIEPRPIGDTKDWGVDDARVEFEEAAGPNPTLVGLTSSATL